MHNERLQATQKIFTANLGFLRMQRLMIIKMGEVFRGGMSSLQEIPEIRECAQATDEVIAAFDKLTATMTRAMDRAETFCDTSND